jgi:tripartite-type tricarboxylate transporter receptor subunit TctC
MPRLLLALLAMLAVPAAYAQTYPSRTIRVVSPFAPGGGTDFLARTVGQYLADSNKWTVVVENRAGANGALGLSEVAKSEPSGHDLVLGQMDNLILAPWLTKVSYDSVKDFTPVALIGKTPIVFLVAAKSPHKSFQDVAAAAKAKPGTVTLGSSGTGSISHLANELLRLRGDILMRHVPYRGSAPALGDLMGGHVDVVGSSIASALALIKSGNVRPLALSSTKRSPVLPDVPTFAELGIPGVEVGSWYGVLGPAGLPAEVTKRLNADVNAMMARPDILAKLGDQGIEPVPQSPEEFAALVRTDYTTWRDIITEIGMKRE